MSKLQTFVILGTNTICLIFHAKLVEILILDALIMIYWKI